MGARSFLVALSKVSLRMPGAFVDRSPGVDVAETVLGSMRSVETVLVLKVVGVGVDKVLDQSYGWLPHSRV